MIGKQWHDVCNAVIYESSGTYTEFARSYAINGESMTCESDIRTQAQYILVNLQYWRGERAREVKAMLRSIIEGK